MKAQKYPVTKIIVGAVLYRATVVETEGGGFSLYIARHEVSSIRKGKGIDSGKLKTRFVYLIELIEGLSWVKLSPKKGHYGWDASIPDWMRTRFAVGDDLPPGIYTTKLAALRYSKHMESANRARFHRWAAEANTSHDDLIAIAEKKGSVQNSVSLL